MNLNLFVIKQMFDFKQETYDKLNSVYIDLIN